MIRTCLQDLHNLHELVHVFSGGHEPLQHEDLEVLVHVAVHPAHHLQGAEARKVDVRL